MFMQMKMIGGGDDIKDIFGWSSQLRKTWSSFDFILLMVMPKPDLDYCFSILVAKGSERDTFQYIAGLLCPGLCVGR